MEGLGGFLIIVGWLVCGFGLTYAASNHTTYDAVLEALFPQSVDTEEAARTMRVGTAIIIFGALIIVTGLVCLFGNQIGICTPSLE